MDNLQHVSDAVRVGSEIIWTWHEGAEREAMFYGAWIVATTGDDCAWLQYLHQTCTYLVREARRHA